MKKSIVAIGFFCFLSAKNAFASEKAQLIPNLENGAKKAVVCAACHGAEGISSSGDFPNLAGQGEKYILKQLRDFKSGARISLIMAGQAANLTEQDMVDLAGYFSRKTPAKGRAVGAGENPKEMILLGEAIYRGGDIGLAIPACAACHGPNGAGIEPAGFPRLAGQHWQYLRKQMQNFHNAAIKDEQASDYKADPGSVRANDPNEMMRDIMKKLNPKQMEAVAHYMQGLR